MAIKVQGQYYIQLNIEGKEDFININDLSRLILEEQAGNLLPVFEMDFETLDLSVLPYLNEGSNIKLIYGVDDDLREANLIIQTAEISHDTFPYASVLIGGICTSIAYSDNQAIRVIAGTSIDAIKQVTGGLLKWHKNNLSASNDSMNWRQSGDRHRTFVTDIWLNSYIANDTILCSITIDGQFKYNSIRNILKGGYRYKLINTNITDTKKDVQYYGHFNTQKSGIINKAYGKLRAQKIVNIETGATVDTTPTLLKPIALTKYKLGNTTVNTGIKHSCVTNSNTHANYNSAYLSNVTNISVMMRSTESIIIPNKLLDISTLDAVYLDLDSLEESNTAPSAEHGSGLYLVSEIRYIFMNNIFSTELTLVRESNNSIKGSLLK
jgi:hypothetical protein